MRATTPVWRDARAWGATAWWAAVPGGVLFAVLQVRGYLAADMAGVDSHAYWLAARDLTLAYDVPVSHRDAFLYSPVFAQVLWPFAQLPWPVFGLGWLAAQLATIGWLVRPLGVWKGAVLTLFVAGELVLGNVYVFLAALLVLAVGGRGEALVPMALTKVTHAVVGLYLVLRGRWREVVTAAALLLVVVGTSWALAPDAWGAWLNLLVESSGSDRGSTLPVRLLVAVLLVAVGSRLERSVLLAPAMVLATPVLDGLTFLALLLALPRLAVHDASRSRPGADTSRAV